MAGAILYGALLFIAVYYTLHDTVLNMQERFNELYRTYNPIIPVQISRLWITGILTTFMAVNLSTCFLYFAAYKDYSFIDSSV